MIEESARVIASEDGFALVETQTRAACGSCGSAGSCGASVLSGLFKRRHNHLKVLNPIHATPGQQVVIGLQERALVTASLTTYLLPLVCLIVLAIAAQQAALYWRWPDTELSSIAGGLLGLIIGLGLLKRFSQRRQHDPSFQAVILRQEISQPVQIGYPSAE
ncbi:MAG: SoxR reducing system RseC family protein [Pseudomonadota bacterium]